MDEPSFTALLRLEFAECSINQRISAEITKNAERRSQASNQKTTFCLPRG
jgi:hypothetical protein